MRSNPVRNRWFGVILTPRGTFWQQLRTKSLLGRHFLAQARIFAGSVSRAAPQAPATTPPSLYTRKQATAIADDL